MIIKNKTISSILKGNQTIDKIMKGTLTVYESFKTLIASGVPPLTLFNCKGVDLIDYKLYGNSVQGNIPISMNNMRTGYYLDVDGNEVSHGYWSITDYIEVNGTDFTLYNVGGATPCVCGYDENKNLVCSQIYGTTGGRVRTDINIKSEALLKYVRLSYFNEWEDGSVRLVQIPTPDTPIEIESVGDKTKNLFNSETKKYSGASTVVTQNKNEIIITQTGNATWCSANFPIPLDLIGKKVTISADVKISGANVVRMRVLWMNQHSAVGNLGGLMSPSIVQSDEFQRISFTGILPENTTENDYTLCLLLYSNTSGELEKGVTYTATYKNIQLEIGDSVSEYEPYGYKIPVKASGKNLFNINNITPDVNNATIDGNIIYTHAYGIGIKNKLKELCPELKVGDVAVLNGESNASVNGNLLNCIHLTGANVRWSFGKTLTITQEHLDSLPVFYCVREDGVNKEGYYKNVQIELGTPTEYEPYHEPITTNIYLNEPLRKIGDYADYIDFENKKVVRQIKEVVLDGVSINKKIANVTLYSNNLYYATVTGLSGIFGSAEVVTNTHFIPAVGVTLVHCYNTAGGTIHVMVHTNQELNTVDLWNDWLKEQYAKGTPIKVTYALATPIEETIELPNIPTLKGTTVIEVDPNIQPSNLEVTYKGK